MLKVARVFEIVFSTVSYACRFYAKVNKKVISMQVIFSVTVLKDSSSSTKFK